MNSHKALLNEVFGESSDSEEDFQEQISLKKSPNANGSQLTIEKTPIWEPVKEINGLWLCSEFLSSQQQASLLSAIEKEGLFSDAAHNQAMKFGNLPSWATELSHAIHKGVVLGEYVSELPTSNVEKDKYALPLDLLWREPLFDQLIVNVYQPGEGICAHVDLMRFADGIAIVSLESPCVMHFTQVKDDTDRASEVDKCLGTEKVAVFVNPGSLVLMSGEARYLWKHEINRKPGFQMWKEQEIDQKRRTSITLRRLCEME